MTDEHVLEYFFRLAVQTSDEHAVASTAQRFGLSREDVWDLIEGDDEGENYENRDFDHEAAMYADFYG